VEAKLCEEADQEELSFLQIIAQLLSERLIPFVVLDVRSERVSVGRALDLPVYFGDAGSREVQSLVSYFHRNDPFHMMEG
jgi:hypothetical protein